MGEDQWQKKYYRVLDRFEEAENRWDAERDVFARGLVKVSHVGDGIARDLDAALQALRTAVQKKKPLDEVDAGIRQVADTLIALDSARSSEPEQLGLDPECLIRPFEQFYLPVPMRKRLTTLEDAMRSPSVGTAEFLTDYGDFLKTVLGFFAEQWVESTREPDAQFADQAPEVLRPEQGEALRKELLRLIDALPVPEEYNERVLVVRDQLSSGVPSSDLPKQVAELVDALLAYNEREREGLATIASEIAARISQFVGFADRVAVDQQEGEAARQKLDDEMRDSLSGMQSAVDEATSLGDLQRRTRASLSSLLERLDVFMEDESKRRDEFQTELSQTKAQLGQAEDETAKLRGELQKQRERSLLDSLTRLPNRQSYELRIGHEFERWRRYGSQCAVVMLDVDHFKPINDEFGHLAGDRVLRAIGKLVREQVRRTDFAGRYGGEEFVLLLPGTDVAKAVDVAEKVREAVSKAPFRFRDRRVDVTMSLGVAAFGKGDQRYEEAVERADKALYRAKNNGRNRVEIGNKSA